MGNEHSQLPGIEIEEKVIEVSDFWSQHRAYVDEDSSITVFVGDLFTNEPFWSPSSPLEKFSKNIILYRHPCIVKYILSWQKASKFYLAVEEVTPLTLVLPKKSAMEICLGLHSILKALCFLHDKAMVSHNNICASAIFVSKEGNWKLGGMEYLCSYKELSTDFHKKSKSHRYNKAIDSNEEQYLKSSKNKEFIDVYAFCVLVNDVFKSKDDSDLYDISSFKDYCKNVIQNSDISQRPNLKSILEHPFFKQKFISIHSYLVELPLKTESEKNDFFCNLKAELELFDEDIVASQLGGLLVARMVVINEAALNHFLPYFLNPTEGHGDGLFSKETFQQYIAPKLLKIFSVRDVQIRLVLLKYFPQYRDCFSKQELQSIVLPELLLGIKDTNNDLVSITLHILADLVPILGAETVIGGKRANLFKDNRPKTHAHNTQKQSKAKLENDAPEMLPSNIDQLSVTSSMAELIQIQNELPERPRPDGEEGESTDEAEQSLGEDDNWEDWGNTDAQTGNNQTASVENTESEEATTKQVLNLATSATFDTNILPKKIVDITELDIKNQTLPVLGVNEVDFFQDMEPVIESSNKFLMENIKEKDLSINSKLCVNTDDAGDADGWGDEWE